ncbi:uncharacterized protein N7484_004043 [Penicillium longicatenatum]|uniref:uncharacterized protein n=1 Tax=Penicillium longicatenatum TaxID=1561947 RepID=UPI0025470C60|nr:uncharacterized protein N7484_004043 [Penicillium longicatenatum]KAJ5650320.1 hypothetical protein N7484_004043 [Penicillium longicatenatum]
MRPAVFLVALAPAVLAGPSPRAPDSTDLAMRSTPSIPDLAPRIADSEPMMGKLGARHILQARSEGSLGQTPWIGMAIGLTCTALAAVMLG